MILEILVAVQIFTFIIMATNYVNNKNKQQEQKRIAEVRRMNYMADASSASSMEEGFDVDFDVKQQNVWNRHVRNILKY